jgi:phosphate uptake regulator
MHIRKLVKAGPSSHTVSLPKEWLTKNSLSKGSTVYITEHNDNELILRTGMREISIQEKEKTIKIDEKDLAAIGRELTSAYINNYSSFAFMGDSLPEKIWEIRRLIRTFIALEITEQKDKRLVVNDLLNLKEISVDKVLRRMDMILRSMIQDSIASVGKSGTEDSIRNRDYDVNRFYFLSYRLLKGSLTNPSLAQHLELSQDEAFENWIVTDNVEGFADSVKHSISYCQNVKTGKEEIKKHYTELESLYLESMKSHFNKDKSLAEEVVKKRITIDEATSKIKSHELRELFKTMSTCASNIARSVIDQDITDKE